jgi:hypothetical protein
VAEVLDKPWRKRYVIHMTTKTSTHTITADRIVVGNKILTKDRKRPVEVFAQLSAPENADYFEFAAFSTNGPCAIRLHRSETVEVVAR